MQRFHHISLLALTMLSTMGCPTAAELSMRAAPGIPDPGNCTPDVGVCVYDVDAGTVMPAFCSRSRRLWPGLPRDGHGRQRVCAPGEGCALNDAGVAHCTARVAQ